MVEPELIIGGVATPFTAVWVHLKPRPYNPVGYEVRVPRPLWKAVFDPQSRRPEGVGWAKFLWSEVEDLGTFIVGAWFETIARHVSAGDRRWEWVVATLEGITEDEEWISLAGKTERFEPRRFA